MTEKKLRGFAAIKARDPERFMALVKSGGSKSGGNFKHRTPEERRELGRKGGRAKK